MNMIGACWMRRSLGEPISALLIDSHHNVIAGGWNGQLTKWTANGDQLWSVKLPDRIGSIAFDDTGVYVTAGLHLAAINTENGEVFWQHALEGSADQVVIFQDSIYATSSVYDIEHNDFIDSAVWCFNVEGKKIWETHMDERPWTIIATKDALMVGLGRPKMGAATISQNGELTHIALDSDSPVTTGIDSVNGALFGHANGDLTTPDGKIFSGKNQSLNVICVSDSGAITLGNNNDITHLNSTFEQVWQVQGESVTAYSNGIVVDGCATVWTGYQDNLNGLLKVLSQENGSEISAMSCGKINSIVSNGKRVAVGDDKGELFVWEDDLFNRRLNSTDEEEDDTRRSMRDRLKALRKR